MAPGAMPSSYRFDKAKRRRVGPRRSREGREEQLRIDDWMKSAEPVPEDAQ